MAVPVLPLQYWEGRGGCVVDCECTYYLKSAARENEEKRENEENTTMRENTSWYGK